MYSLSYHMLFIYIEQFSELQFLAGLKFFMFNDYSIQFIFYFLYINLQISIAFLVSSAFSKVETASGTTVNSFLSNFLRNMLKKHIFFLFNVQIVVVSYIHIFGSGLLGAFLFQFLLEDVSFPSKILKIRYSPKTNCKLI